MEQHSPQGNYQLVDFRRITIDASGPTVAAPELALGSWFGRAVADNPASSPFPAMVIEPSFHLDGNAIFNNSQEEATTHTTAHGAWAVLADGTVLANLLWLDNESAKRFGDATRFQALTLQQQRDICDDICYGPDAAPGFEAASRFFDKVRDLTATAFWTTDEDMLDLQYIGNTPLASWGPPPPEVLRHLGLE